MLLQYRLMVLMGKIQLRVAIRRPYTFSQELNGRSQMFFTHQDKTEVLVIID